MKKVKFKSHTITIDDSSGSDELFIDGKSIPYYKNKAGYSIYYNIGYGTLISAAKAFLKTQS